MVDVLKVVVAEKFVGSVVVFEKVVFNVEKVVLVEIVLKVEQMDPLVELGWVRIRWGGGR